MAKTVDHQKMLMEKITQIGTFSVMLEWAQNITYIVYITSVVYYIVGAYFSVLTSMQSGWQH